MQNYNMLQWNPIIELLLNDAKNLPIRIRDHLRYIKIPQGGMNGNAILIIVAISRNMPTHTFKPILVAKSLVW